MLENEGLAAVSLQRGGYPSFGAASRVGGDISGCAWLVILGFGQLEIDSRHWCCETQEAEAVQGVALATAWKHIEVSIATMAGMPLLCIKEKDVTGGMFGFEDIDNAAFEVDLDRLDLNGLAGKIAEWSIAVREVAN